MMAAKMTQRIQTMTTTQSMTSMTTVSGPHTIHPDQHGSQIQPQTSTGMDAETATKTPMTMLMASTMLLMTVPPFLALR